MKYRLFAVMAVALAAFSGVTGRLFSASVYFKGYHFTGQVVRSGGGGYREFFENGRTTLKVRPNEEYSVVIRNPLPVRVAVALSIDGLNSIDGKHTSLRNARKWLIEPYSSVTISGWQTSMKTLRKFLFTGQSEAFAQWKENKEGKKYTRNLGVIGIAWFWNAGELETALNPPQPFAAEFSKADDIRKNRDKSASGAAPRAESKAGTGMGSQQQHHVTEVEFTDNAGMYSVRDVLKIFYEFADETPMPRPFIDVEDDDGRFTPDMHQ